MLDAQFVNAARLVTGGPHQHVSPHTQNAQRCVVAVKLAPAAFLADVDHDRADLAVRIVEADAGLAAFRPDERSRQFRERPRRYVVDVAITDHRRGPVTGQVTTPLASSTRLRNLTMSGATARRSARMTTWACDCRRRHLRKEKSVALPSTRCSQKPAFPYTGLDCTLNQATPAPILRSASGWRSSKLAMKAASEPTSTVPTGTSRSNWRQRSASFMAATRHCHDYGLY